MNNSILLEQLGINLHGKNSGAIKTQCPKCSESRRNKRDTCLSVDIDGGIYNCHHCEWKGRVYQKVKKDFVRPVKRLEKLNPETIKYFEDHRRISNNTLLRLNVSDSLEWMPMAQSEIPVICFNYFVGDDLVNIKFRGKGKDFKMCKGAELVFYNLNSIENEKEACICEGEVDCLSLHEAGVFNSVSVPNGASKGSQKLEYLDNCWQYFEGKEKIILLTDADEAGYALRDELARRLGKHRCYKVIYPEDCKDSNEVLVKYGKEKLKQVVYNAKQWPLDGVLHIEPDLMEDICYYWEHGYPEGIKLNISELDELITFAPGQFTTVTGIPSSGKSEFIDHIIVQSAKTNKWKWGICSFENQPSAIHATKLMQKYTGKAFGFRKNPYDRMSQEQMEGAVFFVHDYFTFMKISEIDLSMDGILDKATEMVKREGTNGFVIDPWNYIEHLIPFGKTETQYVSDCLTKIKSFCITTGTHVILVAHPTKLKKENGRYETPTLYSISGSAHFFNKTDNGIALDRDFEKEVVRVYVQKVRFDWIGRIGSCDFNFNKETRQYLPI